MVNSDRGLIIDNHDGANTRGSRKWIFNEILILFHRTFNFELIYVLLIRYYKTNTVVYT